MGKAFCPSSALVGEAQLRGDEGVPKLELGHEGRRFHRAGLAFLSPSPSLAVSLPSPGVSAPMRGFSGGRFRVPLPRFGVPSLSLAVSGLRFHVSGLTLGIS